MTLTRLSLFFLFFSPIAAIAQLTGRVVNPAGEGVPFTSIYIEKTTRGTSANADGYYSLDVEAGDYAVVFQQVGYQKTFKKVTFRGGALRLDVVLLPAIVEMSEFVVKANAEDPAYPIIRKAIERRKYFRDQVKTWYSDVYIKGVQRIVSAPKKLLGKEIGTLGGILDSNRQGIVYLSETRSKYYQQRPDKTKEELLSSKVSGQDNGFGFNRAAIFDFSFYDNHFEIQRSILSPIADNALSYYRYRLIGTIKDEQGHDVKKIEVIPKRSSDPTWGGFIYIVDNQWNIYSVDLFLTGTSIQVPILDTVWFRQTHVQVEAPDIWRPLSQVIEFKLHLLGIHIKGNFTGVFSNYNLHPDLLKNFFGPEVFKVEKGAAEVKSSYWDSIRPIPLTAEEGRDYIKRDSLKNIHESKPYRDSVDRKANKFSFASLLTGYAHRNSQDHTNWSVGSPINDIGLNPVQGWNVALPVVFRKNLEKEGYRYWSANAKLDYGFSEQVFRASGGLTARFDAFHAAVLSISGGRAIEQFNPSDPISQGMNELEMWLAGKSYLRLYDKQFFRLKYSRETVNGLFVDGSVEGARRSPLAIHYQKNNPNDLQYTNLPDNISGVPDVGVSNNFNIRLSATYRFRQYYSTYPDHKEIDADQNYPVIGLVYKKVIPLSAGDTDYDQLQLHLTQSRIGIGIWGFSEARLSVGTFLQKTNVPFYDYHHFNGNQTILGNQNSYMNSFFQLPYYQYSTKGAYLEAHWQHHFEGFFLDKIPLLRKLGGREIVKISFLKTPDLSNYTEFSFGIDNLGVGLFRLFRVDVVTHLQEGKWGAPGVVLGIGL